MKTEDNKDKKVIELEDLIAETEQKIINDEYYEDCQVEYRDALVNVRIQPITQAELTKLTNNRGEIQGVEFYSEVLQRCILNKHDNTQFTLEQINTLFTGGLAITLALKCLEISGITFNKGQFKKLRNF